MHRKTELRKSNLKLRELMAPSDYQQRSLVICHRFEQLIEKRRPSLILSYSPIKNEVNIAGIAPIAEEYSIPYALPIIEIAHREMDFYAISDMDELVHNRFGIGEPHPDRHPVVSLDKFNQEDIYCLIPALAFDLRGNRIGYGKGFYDNFLKKYPGIVRIGVAFEMQIVYEIPHDPHDIPMDMVITEKRILMVKNTL